MSAPDELVNGSKKTAVLIAAGGTGGHIYPGIALAEAIRQRYPSREISFLGTPRGLEQELIPAEGFEVDLVPMVPFTRSQILRLPFALTSASLQARRIMAKRQIAVVASMGGYPSLPAVVAARWLGLPTVIHESGATLGRANLAATYLTKNVALTFPDLRSRIRAGVSVRVVGMPLRDQIASMDRDALRPQGRSLYGVGEDRALVLIVGGSQGAASLNAAAIGLANRWRSRSDIKIVVKAGSKHSQQMAEQIASVTGPENAEVVGFIERMDLAYAAADVMICRAGAGTVAELAVAGLPAILVPYPHAPGDHQMLNASELLTAGAAKVVADAQADADTLGQLIESLIEDRPSLMRMGEAARSVARPRAAHQLADWVMELAGLDLQMGDT